jgi:hypothetical protein
MQKQKKNYPNFFFFFLQVFKLEVKPKQSEQ